jgi:hypothetical protein
MPIQVGGHGTIIAHPSCAAALLKPLNDARGAAELAFYKAVFSPPRSHQPPATLMPRYLGTSAPLPTACPTLEGTGASVSGGGGAAVAAAFNPCEVVGGGEAYLVLEDLAHGFQRPCVMDVKMGVRSWGDGASAEKQAREAAKWPAQERLGLRFTGMVLSGEGAGAPRALGREFCHGLPCEGDAGPRQALGAFLSNGRGGLRRDVAAAFLGHLEAVNAWFLVQHEFCFYSSSLLFLYEAEDRAQGCRAADVRMIDFAHVQATGEGGGARDEGYLVGLQTLMRCLQGMLTEGGAPAAAGGAAAQG